MENKAFDVLNGINVNEHTEKKKTGNAELTYLSWPWAVAQVKKRYPDMQYEIEKFNGLPYVYDPLTGYMVYTKVTIEGITHEMWLPVMDGANKAMKAEPYEYVTGYGQYAKKKTCDAATMFDINKTIMRCLVKNFAMFGLGLYIYAGEDLPETEDDKKKDAPNLMPITGVKEEEGPLPFPEEEMQKTIDKAAWTGLQKELKANGLDPAKVIGYYGVDKPSGISWDLFGQIRAEIKVTKNLAELQLEGK